MQSVSRFAKILSCFTRDTPVLGITQISTQLGLPKTVVHRILGAMADAGLVEHATGSTKYRLGPAAIEMAFAAIGSPDIREVAMPVMVELQQRTGESVTLCVRSGIERTFIAQVESKFPVRMSVEIGQRYPLYAGASGKSILAQFPPEALDDYLAKVALAPITSNTITDPTALRHELTQIQHDGFAVSHGERDQWAASVAAPLFAGNGLVIGSMSVCGPRPRFEGYDLKRIGRVLARATESITSPSK